MLKVLVSFSALLTWIEKTISVIALKSIVNCRSKMAMLARVYIFWRFILDTDCLVVLGKMLARGGFLPLTSPIWCHQGRRGLGIGRFMRCVARMIGGTRRSNIPPLPLALSIHFLVALPSDINQLTKTTSCCTTNSIRRTKNNFTIAKNNITL